MGRSTHTDIIASPAAPGHVARMARDADRSIERWLVLGAATIAVAVEVALSGSDLRALIRVTARTSAVWFTLAFVARPLTSLRAPGAKWLLRNRRYLGLAMGISHTAHLVAIVLVARREGSIFWNKLSTATLIGGGFGYLLLAAMVATSWDGAQAWLGRRRWRALHLTGMWTFWLIFTLAYPPLLLAAALRMWVAMKARSGRTS